MTLTGFAAFGLAVCLGVGSAAAETRIRIMPPDGGVLAAGQRFDIRVEATNDGGSAPRRLTVVVNGKDVTALNSLTDQAGAPLHTANFLLRQRSVATAGPLLIEARTSDGARTAARLTVEAWEGRGTMPAARNVIVLLGDGMGIAHRTAARLVSRGLANGKANGRLAMDTLDVTGLVMTASLNSAITDSSPGMAAYATGQKNTTTRPACFPTTRRTRSTTLASSTSASCCAAPAAPASTSASSPPPT